MKHLYLNLKRFDVPWSSAASTASPPLKDWGRFIVANTQDALAKYDPSRGGVRPVLPRGAHPRRGRGEEARAAPCR